MTCGDAVWDFYTPSATLVDSAIRLERGQYKDYNERLQLMRTAGVEAMKDPVRLKDFAVDDKLELSLKDYLALVMSNNTDIQIQMLSLETALNPSPALQPGDREPPRLIVSAAGQLGERELARVALSTGLKIDKERRP